MGTGEAAKKANTNNNQGQAPEGNQNLERVLTMLPDLYNEIGILEESALTFDLFDCTFPLRDGHKWSLGHTTHGSNAYKQQENDLTRSASSDSVVLKEISADLKLYEMALAHLRLRVSLMQSGKLTCF